MKNNKSLGQHWLKDRVILDEIADSAMLERENQPLCLEIGPGLGTLTSSLLKRFPKVIAVEYDTNLAKNLPKSFPGTNLEVVNQDFLQFNLDKIAEDYVVAGNIPYYITSLIITKLLEARNLPKRIVLLIQKEVAERILAGPGEHTYLSVVVQNRAEVEPGVLVPKQYFTPPPKVDSAVVILRPHQPELSDKVMGLVKQGFSNPRKKLTKNLPYERAKLEEALGKMGLDQNVRPANLTLTDWKKLAELLKIG